MSPSTICPRSLSFSFSYFHIQFITGFLTLPLSMSQSVYLFPHPLQSPRFCFHNLLLKHAGYLQCNELLLSFVLSFVTSSFLLRALNILNFQSLLWAIFTFIFGRCTNNSLGLEHTFTCHTQLSLFSMLFLSSLVIYLIYTFLPLGNVLFFRQS